MGIQTEKILSDLKRETDFAAYLCLLKTILPYYLIIVAVADTGAAPYYTKEHANLMKNLGLRENMFEHFREPYIAVINKGDIVYEKCSSKLDEPLAIRFKANHHEVEVYSAGFQYQVGIGSGAMVMFDGTNYAKNRRGFNFVIFDIDDDKLVDSCVFDTFDSALRNRDRNPCEPYLLSFSSKWGKGVQLCTLQTPRFPPKCLRSVTPWEDKVRADRLSGNRTLHKNMCFGKEKAREIWDKKLVPFCGDFNSFEEFFEAFQVPPSYMDEHGAWYYFDYSSCAIHTQNGLRVTTNQPDSPKRSIFVIGPSTCVCWGVTDENTFESMLQRQLNERCPEKGFIVYNRGFYNTEFSRDLMNLRQLPLKQGDIVLFHSEPIWGIPNCDLTLASVRPHDYGEIFTDDHFSKNGNQMIADGILSFLEKYDFFEKNLTDKWNPPNAKNENNEDDDSLLSAYKHKLKDFYRERLCPKIGAVVMNCNPFTLGHRYLVEQALNECERLIVFVVEEDKSEIPFDNRLSLAKENLADLNNVFVLPSGEFIISSNTFTEYFNKVNLQERKIDTSLDVTIFASEIAPCLNISIRFAGEEPLDTVTKQYNEAMARLLPQYGIAFKEIPRLKVDGQIVTASYVRQMGEKQDFSMLKNLVSDKTYAFLKSFYSMNHRR